MGAYSKKGGGWTSFSYMIHILPIQFEVATEGLGLRVRGGGGSDVHVVYYGTGRQCHATELYRK